MPSRWRSAATISGDALAPPYARAGSPGETACSTKISSDSVSRMTTAAAARRVINANIALPPYRNEVADGVPAEVGDQAQRQHRDARDPRHPPLAEQLAERAGGVGAELGCGRLLPEPQEGQRGQQQNDIGDIEAGADHRGGYHPGQQMIEQDPRPRHLGQPCRLDVWARRERLDLSPDYARVVRPPHDRHADERVHQARAER